MDASRFDALACRLGNRRTVLAGAALLAVTRMSHASEGVQGRKKNRKKRKVCVLAAIRCGGKCVNPRTDARHCGGCGNQCPDGVACVNKVCEESPPA